MDRTYLQLNFVNGVTVVLIVTLGYMFINTVANAVDYYRGGQNA